MPMKKLGRNEPCWCGSGKKYKKCHLNKSDGSYTKINETIKTFKKVFGHEYCLSPQILKEECSGDIVKAHTITKSTSLNAIAQNGHIYQINGTLGSLIKNGRLIVDKVGINYASTFTGFCSKHDNEFFKPIEGNTFNFTKEECFLHAYRSLCIEYFKKESSNDPNLKKIHRGLSPDEDFLDNFTTPFEKGSESGFDDMKTYKLEFDDIMVTKKFDNFRSYVIKFKSSPTVMASGGMFPVYDFLGNLLQNKEDLVNPNIIPDHIYYNSFYSGGAGYFIVSWLESHSKSCMKFIDSLKLIKPDRITDAIIRFLFSSCENIFISPQWWDNLDISKKNKLEERMNYDMRPNTMYKKDYLKDEGINYANWFFESSLELYN